MSYDFKTHNFPLPLLTAISNKKSFSYTKGFSFQKSVQPRINRPDDKISTYVYSTLMPYLTKRRYTAPFLSAAILISRNYNASSKGLQRKPRRDIQYTVHFYIHLSFSNAVLFKGHLIKRKTFSISIMTRLLTAVRIQIISVLTHANYASRIQIQGCNKALGAYLCIFWIYIFIILHFA